MFSVASVCQHDNLRTIKQRMMKLGGYVHCTKMTPEFECRGQRSSSPGTKNKNVRHFVRSRPLGHGPHAAFFSVVVLRGASTPAGKSAHVVWLVNKDKYTFLTTVN